MLFLYLAVLITAMYWLTKSLLPELVKPPLPKARRVPSPKKIIQTNEAEDRVEKLETLLAEKNKNIKVLQTELSIFLVQVREFDKVKILLEEEIQRLREQNRIFRSELGIPAILPKENSII